MAIVETSRIVTPHGLKVFISSPFDEPFREQWALRQNLWQRLHDEGHRPWLYENDAKTAKQIGATPKEIIVSAIENCEAVVTLYLSRAGSFLPKEPFHATAFETFHARRFGKRVYLHVLSSFHRPRLRTVLSVLEPTLPLPNRFVQHSSEIELVEAVVSELELYSLQHFQSRTAGWLADRSHAWLSIHALDQLQADLLDAENLWRAAEIASEVPLLENEISCSCEVKFRYAQILSICAGIFANQGVYHQAIRYSWCSVRMFMESGYSYEMIFQVCAVSGILNMANQIQRAYWVNTFGLQSARRLNSVQLNSLWPAFNDTRGSIMTKLGKLPSALKRIAKSVPLVGGPSPYTVAKHATALSRSGDKQSIDTALRLMVDVALPLAAQQNESVGYVKRDAARLAQLVGDFATAKHELAEAERVCKQQGQLHTLAAVKELQARVLPK